MLSWLVYTYRMRIYNSDVVLRRQLVRRRSAYLHWLHQVMPDEFFPVIKVGHVCIQSLIIVWALKRSTHSLWALKRSKGSKRLVCLFQTSVKLGVLVVWFFILNESGFLLSSPTKWNGLHDPSKLSINVSLSYWILFISCPFASPRLFMTIGKGNPTC